MCLSRSVHPQEPSGGPLGPDQRFTDLCGREWTGQCLFFLFLRFVFVLWEVLTDGGETSTNRNILHHDTIIITTSLSLQCRIMTWKVLICCRVSGFKLSDYPACCSVMRSGCHSEYFPSLPKRCLELVIYTLMIRFNESLKDGLAGHMDTRWQSIDHVTFPNCSATLEPKRV